MRLINCTGLIHIGQRPFFGKVNFAVSIEDYLGKL